MEPMDAAVLELSTKGLLEWLEEDCLYLLQYVYDNFFTAEQDKIIAVEQDVREPIRGKIDLLLDKGRLVVRDWKTAGKLDDRWALRQERSKQFPLYASIIFDQYKEIPLVEVVGLSIDEDNKTGKRKIGSKTLTMEYSEKDLIRAVEEVNQLIVLTKTLDPHVPWPRNESGCRCFGDMYKCPFEDICWKQKNNADFILDTTPELSYSGISEWLRCMERRRLLKSRDWDEEPSEKLALGTAFHDAVAAMYKTKERHGRE